MVDGTIEFDGAQPPIDLSNAYSGGSMLTIEGAGGGYFGSHFVRKAGTGTTALLSASHDRDWELRLQGLGFFGGWIAYSSGQPPVEHFFDGPSLRIRYAQLCIFEDLRFSYHGSDTSTGQEGAPFIVGETDCDACVFKDGNVVWNRAKGEIVNASDARWVRGATHSNWGKDAAGNPGVQRESGIRFKAPIEPNPGPLVVSDVHCEGGGILIEDFLAPSYLRGYHNAARVDLSNCTDVHYDCHGVYFNSAGLYVDGLPQCP